MKAFFLILFAMYTTVAMAQVQEPVKWVYSAKKVNASTYEVHLTATIAGGWHIYSQTTPEGGPVPTAISFAKNPLLSFSGAAKEVGRMERHNEPLFGVDVKQFSGKVDFVQTVKIKGNVKTAVSGSLEFMVCNDKQCLPPKSVMFKIPLK